MSFLAPTVTSALHQLQPILWQTRSIRRAVDLMWSYWSLHDLTQEFSEQSVRWDAARWKSIHETLYTRYFYALHCVCTKPSRSLFVVHWHCQRSCINYKTTLPYSYHECKLAIFAIRRLTHCEGVRLMRRRINYSRQRVDTNQHVSTLIARRCKSVVMLLAALNQL